MTALRVGALTDVGRVRGSNQDSLLVGDAFFAVADGMGGHSGGEIASSIAIEALGAEQGLRSAEELVGRIQDANRAVVDRAEADPSLFGMGTTLVALGVVPVDGSDGIVIANVGDSRCYLHDGATLRQLTKDHSVVQTLVDQGSITAAQAREHPQRNILTRALGIDGRVLADTFELRPVVGDRYLLCSDGLHGEVSDLEITEILESGADPESAATELVLMANAAGGHDNISVVVIDVVEGEPPPSDGGDRVRNVTLGEAWAIRAASELTGLHEAPAGAGGEGEGGLDRRGPGGVDRDEGSRGPAPDESAPAVAAGAPGGGGDPRTEPAALPQLRGGGPGFRTVLFVIVLLGILLGVAGILFVSARSTYYVGFEDSEVVIFRGRPGGVLWLDPTVEESTGIEREEVPASFLDELEEGQEFSSFSEAEEYVQRIRAESGTSDSQDQTGASGGPTAVDPTSSTSTTVPGTDTRPT